ncbi:hypothetical protein HBA12_14990 [Tenacibaculum mesophilum]|uniref:hypothetical protein n=1 Tax=Tenacibaculum mesophilum TaxID=104268 RepID=UPI0014319EE3|nr:hypothetical protein [Tenacibaculum mesophilum]KAF9658479.1 hypothetical protein HBA12_14990 [Tenacibaculum mesophilum]
MIGKEKLKVFRQAFKKANNGKCSLPNRFDFNKITEFEFYTDGMRGGISSRFLFRKNLKGDFFLEFASRNDYSSWHRVILSDGTIYGVKEHNSELGGVIILDKKKTEILSQVLTEKEESPEIENNIFAEKLNEKPEIDRRVNYW